ncbi:MAG: sugar phosphate isomerase/epimerase family protein [Nocardioidaceae bacterium]
MSPFDNTEDRTLAHRLGLSRRQFLAATTGLAAGAVAAGPFAPAAHAADGVLVPPAKRGIILYTVRDTISRDPLTSDLPSGFREVLTHLADIGYRQVEFAGYGQHANAEGGANLGNPAGAALLRQWLDDNGLEAEGNHGGIPSTITDATLAAFDQACEVAAILGMGHIGTGGDPTGSAQKADWDAAAERWNILGERAMSQFGLKLYTHNHDGAYNFLLDSTPDPATGLFTRSSGTRRLEYFLTISDPAFVYLEMDIFWAFVAQHRWHTYTAPDGSSQVDVFQPLEVVQAQTTRFPLFHAKDGRRNPAVTNGYDMVPFGTGDIDFRTFFSEMGAKGLHNPMYEQDNARTFPTGSLDAAELSYQNLAALRG